MIYLLFFVISVVLRTVLRRLQALSKYLLNEWNYKVSHCSQSAFTSVLWSFIFMFLKVSYSLTKRYPSICLKEQ